MSATATCAVCGRTILDGERIHTYVSVTGSHDVCPLCAPRAAAAGWQPADQAEAQALPLPPKRSLLDRFLGRGERDEGGVEESAEPMKEPAPLAESELAEEPEVAAARDEELGGVELRDEQPEGIEARGEGQPRRRFGRRRAAPEPDAPVPDSGSEPASAARPDPAGPGMRGRSRPLDDAEADLSPTSRFERAILRFNVSEAGRTVAGLTRTLGQPSVSVGASASGPQDVRITVAWELSWYQWGVDLGDELRPVFQLAKGYEIAELEPSARQWNATAVEGRIAIGAPEHGAERGDTVRH
jgi:hypothetical protein